MTTPFNNPWVAIFLDQMWACRQVTEVVAKTAGSDLLAHRQALTRLDLCLDEPRLNPLEFHGKRPSAGSRVHRTRRTPS